MALDWTAMEGAIKSWVVSGTTLNTSNVIWMGQTEPTSPAYATLMFVGVSRVGSVDELENVTDVTRPAGQEVEAVLKGRRLLTVSCQIISDALVGDTASRAYLSRAQTALGLPRIQAALEAAGLSFVSDCGVQDGNEQIGSVWRSRGVLTVNFATVDTAMERTGYVEKIGLNGPLS